MSHFTMNTYTEIPLEVDGVSMEASEMDVDIHVPPHDISSITITATVYNPDQKQIDAVYDSMVGDE